MRYHNPQPQPTKKPTDCLLNRKTFVWTWVGFPSGAWAGRGWQRDPGVEATDAGAESRGEGKTRPGEGVGGRGGEEEGGRHTGVEETAAAEERGDGESAEVCY